MNFTQPDIISRLRKDILTREGLQKQPGGLPVDMGWGSINRSFPDGAFPVTAVHEFCCSNEENKTATSGFIAGLLSALMKKNGVVIWISASPYVFAPAFAGFGIEPDKIIFITLPREKDQLWMMEQALKCDCLTAVVGEIRNLDFTASRRLQLAVEQSKVTGFVIRQSVHLNTTACVSRWKITPAASEQEDAMPGIGYTRWNVELSKIRNGKPGNWQLEWRDNRFTEIGSAQALTYQWKREAS